ncbi:PH domain-containing protein [Haloarchaeobius sp. HME9146]|uniref:PH domain-containing protein n=1 Tax=Haloarchaeobius sp. HME9146 TaxID=2978732 RepID=UPI0021BDF4F8|nr:PH domain-containing protein [Haloarchaeobius sp. HME9146]MCT9096201.1 PH domain-containing protein [Haloarchaeobius sp. HME9146]
MASTESAYDWLTLDEDEEIVWSGIPDAKSIYPALIIGLPLCLVLIGIPIVVGAYLQRENTEYVVTTDGLYKKTGILSRDVQKIDFDKVQNISFSESFLGKQFGFGNVDISTAGGSGVEMQFMAVSDPKQVQELINKRIKQARGTQKDGDEDKEQVLNDILVELRAIRESFERIEGETPDSNQAGSTDDFDWENTDR